MQFGEFGVADPACSGDGCQSAAKSLRHGLEADRYTVQLGLGNEVLLGLI